MAVNSQLVRMSKELHSVLKVYASIKGTSISELVNESLAKTHGQALKDTAVMVGLPNEVINEIEELRNATAK